MPIKFILFLVLFWNQKVIAQKVFNKLTDLDDFFVDYYNGNSCPTDKNGNVYIRYYDKDYKYDSGAYLHSAGLLRKFNTEGNIVAKTPNTFKKKNEDIYYYFNFYEMYEDKLYGIGNKSVSVKNNPNVAKNYFVVTEFDTSTLAPLYSNEYSLFSGFDSSSIRLMYINETPPLVEGSKFFYTVTTNADSITGAYDTLYWTYLNFNFKEKVFYINKYISDRQYGNIFENAIKLGKDTFCSFTGSLSPDLNGGKRYNDIYIFDKKLNFVKPSTIKFVDTLSYYAITGGYDMKTSIIKGDSSYIFSYTHVELKRKGVGFDTIRGLHRYKFFRDTLYYDGVIDTGYYPYGYYMGKGYAVNNYIFDPIDSGYYLSYYDNNLSRNNSFVIYKLNKDFKVNWKRRYVEDNNKLLGISNGESHICMGYDYKRGGVVIPFDAIDSIGTNVFLLWVDRNGNPLKIGGKDLTGSSILDYGAKIDLQIYPNPCKEYLNISFKDKKNLKNTYRIYSLDGKLMQESSLNSEKIDISLFSKGTYVLQVLSPDFEIMGNKRFIKE